MRGIYVNMWHHYDTLGPRTNNNVAAYNNNVDISLTFSTNQFDFDSLIKILPKNHIYQNIYSKFFTGLCFNFESFCYMPFDEIFPPQLQASNGQQNNCHRQCKCMGEPLLLDVLAQ